MTKAEMALKFKVYKLITEEIVQAIEDKAIPENLYADQKEYMDYLHNTLTRINAEISTLFTKRS